MQPTIINPDSKFVVVTYWWGRGNINKNTGVPCPDVKTPDEPYQKEPIRFEQMLEGWVENLESHKCNHMAVEYPEFAKPGGYQLAINHKPAFILQALKACHPRAIVYIDGDMFVNRYPYIFDIEDIDYAARSWNADPRDAFDEKSPCFDPYVFETSGGIQMFGQTPYAYRMIEWWMELIKKYPGKADDRILSMSFNHHKFLLAANTIQLPIEYLWLTMDYVGGKEINPRFFKKSEITVEHPACLTSEDRATSLGASSNRVPAVYDRLISDHMRCNNKYGDFFEYVFFDSKRQRLTMKTYLKWLKDHHVMRLVPFNQKYGAYNPVAKKTQKLAESIVLLSNNDSEFVIVTMDSTATKLGSSHPVHVVPQKQLLLPTIYAYLNAGANVVFQPVLGKVQKKLLNLKDGQVEFICKNINDKTTRYKKEFTLKIDRTQQMYFAAKSKILRHLLLVSGDLKSLDKRFNSSFTFLSRIRCKWM